VTVSETETQWLRRIIAEAHAALTEPRPMGVDMEKHVGDRAFTATIILAKAMR